jgi:hypothetical protein
MCMVGKPLSRVEQRNSASDSGPSVKDVSQHARICGAPWRRLKIPRQLASQGPGRCPPASRDSWGVLRSKGSDMHRNNVPEPSDAQGRPPLLLLLGPGEGPGYLGSLSQRATRKNLLGHLTVTKGVTRRTTDSPKPPLTWSGRRDSNPRPPPWQGGWDWLCDLQRWIDPSMNRVFTFSCNSGGSRRFPVGDGTPTGPLTQSRGYQGTRSGTEVLDPTEADYRYSTTEPHAQRGDAEASSGSVVLNPRYS